MSLEETLEELVDVQRGRIAALEHKLLTAAGELESAISALSSSTTEEMEHRLRTIRGVVAFIQ